MLALLVVSSVPRHPVLPAVPVIGLGTAGAAGLDAEVADAVCAATKECGVRLIDTAQNYGSEAAIGEGLRRSGVTQADGLFMLAKVDLASAAREDPAQRVRRQVRSSLERLGVRKLDAVVIHWPICLDRACTEAEHAESRRGAWGALEELVAEGVIGLIGTSNWSAALLDELLAHAKVRPSINEVESSPACPQNELLDYCARHGIAVVGYSPYGGCWLADYYTDFVPWGAESKGKNLIRSPAVAAIAAELGCSAAQVLLAWAVERGVVPIPKSTKPTRIAESLAACAIELRASHIAALDGLADPRRGVQPSIDAHRAIIAHEHYDWTPT